MFIIFSVHAFREHPMHTTIIFPRPVVPLTLLLVSAAAVLQAADPTYYVRKPTWHETMRASRDAMSVERAALLERAGLRAGDRKSVV